MAQQNIIVKLSLKDADLVTRGLQSAGTEGERAEAHRGRGARTDAGAEGAGRRVGRTQKPARRA
jgi:hypothetical protein